MAVMKKSVFILIGGLVLAGIYVFCIPIEDVADIQGFDCDENGVCYSTGISCRGSDSPVQQRFKWGNDVAGLESCVFMPASSYNIAAGETRTIADSDATSKGDTEPPNRTGEIDVKCDNEKSEIVPVLNTGTCYKTCAGGEEDGVMYDVATWTGTVAGETCSASPKVNIQLKGFSKSAEVVVIDSDTGTDSAVPEGTGRASVACEEVNGKVMLVLTPIPLPTCNKSCSNGSHRITWTVSGNTCSGEVTIPGALRHGRTTIEDYSEIFNLMTTETATNVGTARDVVLKCDQGELKYSTGQKKTAPAHTCVPGVCAAGSVVTWGDGDACIGRTTSDTSTGTSTVSTVTIMAEEVAQSNEPGLTAVYEGSSAEFQCRYNSESGVVALEKTDAVSPCVPTHCKVTAPIRVMWDTGMDEMCESDIPAGTYSVGGDTGIILAKEFTNNNRIVYGCAKENNTVVLRELTGQAQCDP